MEEDTKNALQSLDQKIDQRFEKLAESLEALAGLAKTKLDKIDDRLDQDMLTKDRFDEKLSDLKSDLIDIVRKES